MKRYAKKPTATVFAIQLNLESVTESKVLMHYFKWGGAQAAQSGDWIVQNGDEVYTVNRESFAATYQEVAPGIYFKTGNVWAEQALVDGKMPTKEGVSEYKGGDFLVYNTADRQDGYCMPPERFNSLYDEVTA